MRPRFDHIRPPRARTITSPASETDAQMMVASLALAREAALLGEVPVGAVVYETATARILGAASNRREADADPTAHAEIIALREAARARGDWRLDGCSIAVTLEPCPMCAGACVNARIDRIVYAADDPKAGAVRTLYTIADDPRLNHRCTLIPHIMAGESAALLRAFFRARRK